MELSFVPINNKCVDCGTEVFKDERQEIAWDLENNCRRRCGACILKDELKAAQYKRLTIDRKIA